MSANVACLLLVMARSAGALGLSPLLGGEIVPARVRTVAAGAFGLALFPFVDRPVMPAQVPFLSLLPGLVIELGLGALMGWGASLLVQGARMAGAFADQEIRGIADESGVLTEFQGVLATVIFFLVNGHQWFLSGFLKSFRVWPLGAFSISDAWSGTTAARLLATAMEVAIKLAAPVIVVSLLVTLALLLAGRFFPTGGQSAAGVRPIMATGVMLVGIGTMMSVLAWNVPEFGTVWANSLGLN
jgi:flagellar biosynthetic protein FliR